MFLGGDNMFCKNCGKKLEEGAKFCGACGTKQEEINNSHRKMGKKTIPIVLIAISIIGLVAIGIWYYKAHETQIIFCSTFDSFMSKYSNVIEETNETLNKVQKINADMSIKPNELGETFKIKANVELDTRNRKSNINYDLLYNDTSKIKGYFYINDNSNFANITSSKFSKTVKLPEEWKIGEYIELANLDARVTFINKMSKVIKNNLKNEYFSRDKVEIETYGYDGEITVIKNSLTLSENDLSELLDNILNDISKDKELEKALEETATYAEKFAEKTYDLGLRNNYWIRYTISIYVINAQRW